MKPHHKHKATNTEPEGKFQFFDDPMLFYNAMLSDIRNARKHIYLETYKFGHQYIGIKFRDALTKKAAEGVEVKILIDSWGGSSIPDTFFSHFIKAGGQVRYFEKIKINIDFFTRSHRRNHRKILVIDDHISYIGSPNFTGYNMNWRESVLRMDDFALTEKFKSVFLLDFSIYNKYVIYRRSFTKPLFAGDFEILRDAPSISRQRLKKRYEQMIRQATREIIIETPYFLPGYVLRKLLMDAAQRGVKVKVIIPKHSDVRLADLLRNRYVGQLHEKGVEFSFYTPHNLHAKIFMTDRSVFSLGSANFDYRSFRYMHEISLIGTHETIISQINRHINETHEYCEPYDYELWLRRPRIQKFFEWLLLPLRHLL